jgi:4-hydroxy-tetrahydrodipicolinate synthase
MTDSIGRNRSRLSGLHVALFTPLRDDCPKRLYNSIDYEKAGAMIDTLLEVGVQGFVAVATTGQSPTVTPEQHVEYVRFVHQRVRGRALVIAGAGSNCTREAVELIRELREIDADMPCLCVTGYYNNPPQEGLYDHFTTLADETGAQIVLYNVPSRTGSNLEPETVIALSEHPGIIGLKQALDFAHPGTYREDTLRIARETADRDFVLLSGEDDSLVEILEMGGTGIISATSNIPEAARRYLEILSAYAGGDQAKAHALQEDILPFVRMVFSRKSPIPLAALFGSPVFQPLSPLQATQGGEALWDEMVQWARNHAPSLQRWWKS